ncbi:MAG: hypothetical protein AAGI37_10285 [Planctomycetota bacterium]
MPDAATEPDATPEPVKRADHHGSGVDHPAESTRPRKRLRRILIRAMLALLVFGVVLIALAPTLLSTGPGTRWLVSVLNDRLPGQVKVNDLSLSWFGGQHVVGIRYDDPGQGLVAEITAIDAGEVGLFHLLTGSRRLGTIALQDPTLTYTEQEVDETKVEPTRQVVKADKAEPFKLPRDASGTLSVSNLTVTYVPIGREPIVLTVDQDEVRVPDLRDIGFEMTAIVRQGDKQGRLALKGDVLNLFDPDGAAQAGQAAYDIGFEIDDLPTDALDQVVSGLSDAVKPGQAVALFGEGDLTGKATVNGTIEKLKSRLSITTPKLRVELDQLTENDTLIASPESYARLDLDQDGFAALFPESGLELHKPTRVDLASIEMALPIVDKAVDWDTATASLLLKAGDNLAVVDERGELLGINDLKIVGRSESIAEKLVFKLTTMLSAVDTESNVTEEPIALDLEVYEPLEETRQIAFYSEKLPIKLADALAGQDDQLVLWLGETLELDAELQGTIVADAEGNKQVEQRFTLRPSGRVTGTVSGSFSPRRYTAETPADEPIEAVLTPEAFASLMEMLSGREGEPALTIDKDMPVFITLRDPERGAVSVTTRQDKTGIKRFYPDPDRTYLGATVELSPARVFDPRLKKTYELRGGSLTLSAPDLRGKTTIGAELDLWVRPDAGEQGVGSLLTWQTTVTDLLDTEGSMPLDGKTLMQQLAASGQMGLQNVPSGLVDSLLNRQGDLASILGPVVQEMDAGFTYKDGRPTGASVRLNWDDASGLPKPDAWASMRPAQFDIDEDQVLTVRGGEDLELEVKVSEDFGDRWMGRLHPILFDAKSGDRPVKIKIDGKSFRFPLQGEGMKGSRVEASVDLGTIEFGKQALLGKLLEWTDRPAKHAIFEPAKVSLIDGKISYSEFDLAVGKVKLRLDGEVDLSNGQIVDMAVRVPGDSLIRVFNELDGVIPPDDYLSIPMTGAIRKPEFDSKGLGREVARLITSGLIEKEKDKLRDKIREGIGLGDKDRPKPDGDEEKPGEDGAEEPAKDPVEEAAGELIDGALDLIFRRLNRDKE